MANFEIVTVHAYPIIYVQRTSSSAPEAIGGAMQEAFGTLMALLGENEIEMAGAPLAVYHGYGDQETTFDVALPVSPEDAATIAAGDDVKVGETHGGRALKTVHTGPYARLFETYGLIMQHMQREGLEPVGPSWEVYTNDPRSTPEAELATEIFFPLD